MADWKKFELSDDLLDSAESASQIKDSLEAISSAIDSIKPVLNVLSTFLSGTPDPKLAAVKSILNQFQNALDNLRQSGLFALFMVPENINDLAQNYRGGYDEFEQRFVNSLLDTQDSERPQFTNGSIGAVLFFIRSENPSDVLQQNNNFLEFFDRETQKYPSPINLQVVPATQNGAPIDRSLIAAFQGKEQPENLILQWEEPRVANDVLLDLFANNKFYIEVAEDGRGSRIKEDKVERSRENPLEKEMRKGGNSPRLGRYVERPDSDAPIRVWKPLNPSDPFIQPSQAQENFRTNFLAGSYGYLLDNVSKGIENGKYYRVSSVPNDVDLGEVQGHKVLKKNGRIFRDSNTSSPVFGAIPDVSYDFDLPTAILNVFRAGYILRLDERLRENNDALAGNAQLERMLPQTILGIEGTEVYEFQDDNLFRGVRYFSEPLFEKDILDFNESRSQIKSDLVQNPSTFDPFGGVDEFLEPRTGLPANDRFRLAIDRLVQQKVEKLIPIISKNDELFEVFQSAYQANQSDIEDLLTSETPLSELLDEDLRGTVATLLRLTEGNVRQGTPPNWESVNLVEDLLPQVDELFEDLFNTISAFEETLTNASGELQSSIEGIQDRLDKITAIISKIEGVIESLEQIQGLLKNEVAFLYIPPQPGGTSNFIQEVYNSQDKPDSGPQDYFSGAAFAIGGQNPAEFKPAQKAIEFLFDN